MCIVIDANSIPAVFDKGNSKHSDFEPVYDWIRHGNGKIVLGGSTYLEELRKMKSYFRIIKQFSIARKVVSIDNNLVDENEKKVKKIHGSSTTKFDDKHIVAIFRSCDCNLFCSMDSRADKFITDADYYEKPRQIPSIYRKASHSHLINDANFTSCCKPDIEPTKHEEKMMEKL